MKKHWNFFLADDSPILTTAIHAGHEVLVNQRNLYKLDESDRLREEDPFTDNFIQGFPNQCVVNLSRFAVDLNRPLEKAVYVNPELAWGLDVWKKPLSKGHLGKLHNIHQVFFSEVENVVEQILQNNPFLIVLDIHSYNHHRLGPKEKYDDPQLNPEINLGTGTMLIDQWRPIIQCTIEFLAQATVGDGEIIESKKNLRDVRENVKFAGGYLAKFLHKKYLERVCVLSLEFKKVFMEEWTGTPFWLKIKEINQLLLKLQVVLLEELEKLENK